MEAELIDELEELRVEVDKLNKLVICWENDYNVLHQMKIVMQSEYLVLEESHNNLRQNYKDLETRYYGNGAVLKMKDERIKELENERIQDWQKQNRQPHDVDEFYKDDDEE